MSVLRRNQLAFAGHTFVSALLNRQAGRHDWFYYTSTKCAIPDDIVEHSHLQVPIHANVNVEHSHLRVWVLADS